MHRTIPLFITFIGSLVMFIQYFVPTEGSTKLYETVLDWEIVTGTFFLIIGIESLITYHYGKIRGKQENWQYSIVTILALLVMSVIGLAGGITSDPNEMKEEVKSIAVKNPYTAREIIEVGKYYPELAKDIIALYDKDVRFAEKVLDLRPDLARFMIDLWSKDKTKANELVKKALLDPESVKEEVGEVKSYPAAISKSPMFQDFFNFMISPMSATMFSLLAFFIASAAYRSFRARNFDSAILLVVAVIMMLGRIPFGQSIYGKLPAFTEYILEIPNNAMKRGISLGVGMGMLATSIKIMFGIDRSYLGGGD
ncbi:MAG: hypothetical protein JXA60_06855 [Candidatus Coatesbacteria bacterium]|nr:hypothetical protein [Candidatus Coatesbacteria bacterium]